MTLNNPKPRFQGHAILQRWISPKSLKIRPYLLWKAYPSFQMIPFSMILSDLGFVYSADTDADANPDAEGGRGRGLCVFGGLCVDMWRFVHQWSLFAVWLSFDCFWRLVHCTNRQNTQNHWCNNRQRSTKIVPTVYQRCTNRQKQSNDSQNSKNDHRCTNRHMSTKTVPTVYQQCTNRQK